MVVTVTDVHVQACLEFLERKGKDIYPIELAIGALLRIRVGIGSSMSTEGQLKICRPGAHGWFPLGNNLLIWRALQTSSAIMTLTGTFDLDIPQELIQHGNNSN